VGADRAQIAAQEWEADHAQFAAHVQEWGADHVQFAILRRSGEQTTPNSPSWPPSWKGVGADHAQFAILRMRTPEAEAVAEGTISLY